MSKNKVILLITAVLITMVFVPGCFCNCNEPRAIYPPEPAPEPEPEPSEAISTGLSLSPSKLRVGLDTNYEIRVGNYGTEDLEVTEIEISWWYPMGESAEKIESKIVNSSSDGWQKSTLTPDQEFVIYEGSKFFDQVGEWEIKVHIKTDKGERDNDGDITVTPVPDAD